MYYKPHLHDWSIAKATDVEGKHKIGMYIGSHAWQIMEPRDDIDAFVAKKKLTLVGEDNECTYWREDIHKVMGKR